MNRALTLRDAIGWSRNLLSNPTMKPGTHVGSRAKLRTRLLWFVYLLVAIELVYVFFASAGRIADWPSYGNYYDQLAEAFRAGQLHLKIAPHPELLTKANPYSTEHGRLWMIDLTLYDGKYYLYWGPVPALVQALIKTLLGIHKLIGDQYLAFCFFSISTISAALLIERLARRLFVSVSRPLVVVGILTMAFANPIPHLISTGSVYMAAIAGGQAFILTGLLLAFDCVWWAGTSKHRNWRVLVTGVCWALAIGCRISLAPAIGLLTALTAVAIGWAHQGRWKAMLGSSLFIAGPIALAVFSLLSYNQVRFGNWLEFGTNFQVGYYQFSFSLDYWWANAYSYLLRPFETSCHFPYLFQVVNMGPASLPDWLDKPKGYLVNEPVVGWLRAVPITWLIPCAFLARRRFSSLQLASSRAYLWCLASFVILGSVTGFTVMGLYMATMRYLGDVVYGLVLLAILGAFAFRTSRFGRARPRLVGFVISLLGLGTVAMGLILGYQGYIGHIRHFNAPLDRQLRNSLSVCPINAPLPPRYSGWTDPKDL